MSCEWKSAISETSDMSEAVRNYRYRETIAIRMGEVSESLLTAVTGRRVAFPPARERSGP